MEFSSVLVQRITPLGTKTITPVGPSSAKVPLASGGKSMEYKLQQNYTAPGGNNNINTLRTQFLLKKKGDSASNEMSLARFRKILSCVEFRKYSVKDTQFVQPTKVGSNFVKASASYCS